MAYFKITRKNCELGTTSRKGHNIFRLSKSSNIVFLNDVKLIGVAFY